MSDRVEENDTNQGPNGRGGEPDDEALVLPDLLTKMVAGWADQVVLRIDGGEEMTYHQWDLRSNAAARGLIEAGVNHGDRIALHYIGMDWLEYLIAYMGGMKAGAALLHLNEDSTPEEMVELMRRTAAVGMIRGQSASAPPGMKGWEMTLDQFESEDQSPVPVELHPEDLSNILFTSGTTGPPKAIAVPHGNMTYKRNPDNFTVLGDLKPLIAPMQVSSTSSVTTSLVALATPATVVVCDRHDPDRIAALIEQYRVGSVMITPFIAMQMVRARIGDRHDLTSVDTLASASAPFPPPLREPLLSMFPNAKVNISYSSSETYSAVMRTAMSPDRPLSVGRPAPGSDVRVTDEDRTEVPPGTIGDIWLGSDSPKRYYLDNPELNAEVYDGRWVKTGDIGYIGDDGDLYLFDRKRDAIPVDGGLVSTQQVEAVAYGHPAVIDAAVMGVPRSDGTKAVGVALALTDPDEVDSVRTFLADRLSVDSMPTMFTVLAQLPRSHNGKILKRDLLDTFDDPVPV